METLGTRINPDNNKQMMEAKRDIENKVAKILRLIKNSGQDKKDKIPEDSIKRAQLVGLIQDLHKQYQSLHTKYDHLRGEMEKKASSKKSKENFSSASSSDLEYYSSEEIDDGQLINEPATSKLDIGGLKHKLASNAVEREALNSETLAAMNKTQEADTINKDVNNKEHEQKGEHSTLIKVHEVHGSQASAQTKELEGQLTTMKIELESLHSLKKDLESQIENKATEAEELREKNIQLRAWISELELKSKEKGDELSTILKKLNDNEKTSTSRIDDLMAQVSNLQREVDFLRAQNGDKNGRNEASAQVKGLQDQVSVMQQELESVCSQKNDLEHLLDMKAKEVTENLIQIDTLKNEMAQKTICEEGLLKEKEGLLLQREDLELVTNSLRNQKGELEELIRSKNQETDQLHARIFELERILMNRGEELSTFQKKYEDKENEVSAHIRALKAQVNGLQQQLDSLLSKKSNLEMQIERLKLDSAQSQIQVESEIQNLNSKIADQQSVLKEREDTIKKFTEQHKLVKHHSLDSPKYRSLDSPKYRSLDSPRLNPQVLERKVEELAEKFHMKMENHIRLLYQRILVAEKIHYETRDNCKKIKEQLEQENRELNEKKANCEATVRNLSDVLLETGTYLLTGLDSVVRKLNQDNGDFLTRISRISKELQLAKSWITGANCEMKKLKHNVDSLTVQLAEKEEKVQKLEAKLNLEGGDSINAVIQLESQVANLEQQLKEKDGALLGLGEEKREAIRQLCVLIDYHRSCYDHLRQAVSKMTVRSKRTS